MRLPPDISKRLGFVFTWLLVAALATASGDPVAAAPLLPDLVPVASVANNYMYGGNFDIATEPGRVLYRFDAVLANLGDGPFQVFEETDFAAQTQDVYQHVFDTDGSFTSRLMGTFAYEPPPFGHLTLAALARYNLRAVTAGNGVGAVIATHDKTSHAVVDSLAIDTSLPAAPANHVYTNGYAELLGISVGYADLYGRNIPQQRIDVTGLPSAQYWLEVIVDPTGYVEEIDDTNNTARILVDLTIPTTGDNDGDSDVDGADFLLWQRGQSPNAQAAADLADWQANFGANFPIPQLASSTAVPEPPSLLLLGALVAFHLAAVRALPLASRPGH